MPAVQSHAQYVYAEDNCELRSQTKHMAVANVQPLAPEQMGRRYSQGNRAGQFLSARLPDNALIFEHSDAKDWSSAGDGGVAQLIGFRSLDRGPSWTRVLRPPSFMYPLEKELGGATAAFASLWQAMINRRVYGICRLRRSSTNSVVRFCALVPCEEEIDNNCVQVFPPGFQLIYLPWHEELRDGLLLERAQTHDADTLSEDDARDTSAMARLIRAHPLDLDAVQGIHDPVVTAHFAGLESVAGLDSWGDENATRRGGDPTLPGRHLLAQGAANDYEIEAAVDDARLCIYGQDWEERLNEAKFAKENEQLRKKRKAEGPPCDVEGWRDIARAGGIGDFNAPQLKAALSRGGALYDSDLEPEVKRAKKSELVVLVHRALGLHRRQV